MDETTRALLDFAIKAMVFAFSWSLVWSFFVRMSR